MKTKNISKLINSKLIPIIVYKDSPNKYSLQRKNYNKKILNTEFIKKNKKIKQDFHNYLFKFINKIKINFNHCNLNNLSRNIKNVEIKEKYSKFKGSIVLAAYFTKKNKIEIYNKNYNKSLNHELLHLASTKKINKKLVLTGFCILDFKKFRLFGVFINEGYTEYLNSKYFSSSNCYRIQKKFIKQLEEIVGESLMEEMYFNADLKGLINGLMKYNTEEEVIKFIINTDIVHKCVTSLKTLKRFNYKKALNNINTFLVKTYYNKLLSDNLSKDDINAKLSQYIYQLSNIKLIYKNNSNNMKPALELYKNLRKEKKLKQ